MVYVFADWNAWVAIGTLALAGATLVLAALAVLQEPIRRFFGRSKLSMTISLKPPDFIQIEGRLPETGTPTGQLFYVRIRVTHLKGNPAKNTEIMVSKLWRRSARSWEAVDTFIPLSLVWSNSSPRTSTVKVPVGLFRHCDLGSFRKASGILSRPLFVFDFIVQPNAVAGVLPNVLEPGEYKFELICSGDNTNKITQHWKLKFGDKWSDDLAIMQDQIKLTRLG